MKQSPNTVYQDVGNNSTSLSSVGFVYLLCVGTHHEDRIVIFKKKLQLTIPSLSERPDSISIDLVSNASSVVEDKEFQLQCNITNVAPARNLAVRWYQDDQIFKQQTGQVKLSPKNNNKKWIIKLKFVKQFKC